MNLLKQRTAYIRAAGWLIALLGVLATAGCDPEDGGTPFALTLPTDTLLNLRCADAGIGNESCVLIDNENPFKDVVVTEFDVNIVEPDEQLPSFKFNLAEEIPAGPTGAKARFYLYATALARSPLGENQWYTARALHELFDASGDPVIKDQAIRAYRSVLDNFFGSVTFFGPFQLPGGVEFLTSNQLNLLVGDDLFRPAATGFTPLFDAPELARDAMAEWGYTYIACTVTCPDDGFLFVNGN